MSRETEVAAAVDVLLERAKRAVSKLAEITFYPTERENEQDKPGWEFVLSTALRAAFIQLVDLSSKKRPELLQYALTEWARMDPGDYALGPNESLALSEPLHWIRAFRDLLVEDHGHVALEEYKRDQLRAVLGETALLVSRLRASAPEKELHVQEVMDIVLKVWFPDYVPHPGFPGPFKTYRSDGGIPSLKTAIEYKFISSAQELATASSQVAADQGGYQPDANYQEFYSVYYLTDAGLATQRQFDHDLGRSGIKNWHAIRVVGSGARVQSRRQKQH